MEKTVSILSYLLESVSTNMAPLYDYAKNYKSSEDLLKDGGFPIELLDRAAFGFSEGDITEIDPKKLNIKWKDDYDNVLWEVKKSGKGAIGWSKGVNLSEPIDVSYQDGKFWIEDGHHRYFAAKTLGKMLPCVVEIKEKPLAVLFGKNYNYDQIVRDIWKKANE